MKEHEPDLFASRPPVAVAEQFDGRTFDPEQDGPRLHTQLRNVLACMKDGQWRTLDEISSLTGAPSTSVSARLRDLRKPKFGGYTVERRARGERCAGLFEYRVVIHRTADDYPENWPDIARRIKELNNWRCERCNHIHEPATGYCLTVHHLDGVKSNCEDWNLAALCQRCHLTIQGRVVFYQDYALPHSPWMRKHVEGYNAWAHTNGKPLLTLA